MIFLFAALQPIRQFVEGENCIFKSYTPFFPRVSAILCLWTQICIDYFFSKAAEKFPLSCKKEKVMLYNRHTKKIWYDILISNIVDYIYMYYSWGGTIVDLYFSFHRNVGCVIYRCASRTGFSVPDAPPFRALVRRSQITLSCWDCKCIISIIRNYRKHITNK